MTVSEQIHMVVVSYGNAWMTIEAVESLMRQTVPVHFTVWDNNSENHVVGSLLAWFQAVEPEHGRLTMSHRNVLWTPAINRALEETPDGMPFVGFMNNDISLPPHGIESMLEVAARPEVGMVAPTGSRLGGLQDFAHHHGDPDDLESYCAGLVPKRATYLVGACCVLRRGVWDEVGPLDESMPLGADDHDYCIRLKAAGYQIWVDERVYANHRGHASESSENWNEWGEKSWAAFSAKYDGYYSTEEEAIKCHWGGEYHEGWDK